MGSAVFFHILLQRLAYHAFQIEGVKYNSISYAGNHVIFHANIAEKFVCGQNCKFHDVCIKGNKERKFHLPPMGGKQCFLNL